MTTPGDPEREEGIEDGGAPVPPEGPSIGLNIPLAIEELLADVAALKTRLTAAEAEIATLKGA